MDIIQNFESLLTVSFFFIFPQISCCFLFPALLDFVIFSRDWEAIRNCYINISFISLTHHLIVGYPVVLFVYFSVWFSGIWVIMEKLIGLKWWKCCRKGEGSRIVLSLSPLPCFKSKEHGAKASLFLSPNSWL